MSDRMDALEVQLVAEFAKGVERRSPELVHSVSSKKSTSIYKKAVEVRQKHNKDLLRKIEEIWERHFNRMEQLQKNSANRDRDEEEENKISGGSNTSTFITDGRAIASNKIVG